MIEIIKEELSLIVEDEIAEGKTELYGRNGLLDSMGLVNLVVTLEEVIQDKYGVSVNLADEHAMSRSKSPFRTVESFAEYIKALLEKEGVNA